MPLFWSFWLAVVVAVAVCAAVPGPRRLGIVAAISWLWIGFLAPFTVATLSVWGLVCYAALAGTPSRGLVRGVVLALIAQLVLFKYLPPLTPAQVAPVGISYFTFKLIHYALERRRGNLADASVTTFATWLFLFPIFTAGPIERLDHFARSVDAPWSSADMFAGAHRVVHGLIKKFVVADLVVRTVVDTTPEAVVAGEVSAPGLWAFLVATFLFNYLDFSAYSDLAIGVSRMLGLRIAENFDWPVAAVNIGDFWKRWHMTLTGWCQRYVYMPMFARTRSPLAAVYATFVVMGLWHAGSAGWVCWGLWHATGVSLHLAWRRTLRVRGISLPTGSMATLVSRVITLAFVSAGYAFTSISEVGTPVDSLRLLAALVGLGWHHG